MEISLTILGNNSATPTKLRNPSGQYLHCGSDHFLIDCSEGIQQRMLKYAINFQKIGYIFISHLHGDHFLGLPGLLNTMSLNNRTKKLIIVSPIGLKSIHDTLSQISESHFPYEIEFIELIPEKEVTLQTTEFMVQMIPVSHRLPCFSFLFNQKKEERKLNIEACMRYQIPIQEYKNIKAGADFQVNKCLIVSNSELTLPPTPKASYGYITDTFYRPDLAEKFKGTTALYHEATYLHNFLDRAKATHHSTALEAGQFATKASVNQLIIGHFSARYDDLTELLDEAKTVFANTNLAIEGETFVFG
ncbi:MAG: ribonuclease Z [Flavobacteriales bacterium]|nr:ribonuclease Z [Flavobacteriales bacterium]